MRSFYIGSPHHAMGRSSCPSCCTTATCRPLTSMHPTGCHDSGHTHRREPQAMQRAIHQACGHQAAMYRPHAAHRATSRPAAMYGAPHLQCHQGAGIHGIMQTKPPMTAPLQRSTVTMPRATHSSALGSGWPSRMRCHSASSSETTSSTDSGADANKKHQVFKFKYFDVEQGGCAMKVWFNASWKWCADGWHAGLYISYAASAQCIISMDC